METTIKVSKETKRRVMEKKYALDVATADMTINKILDIVETMTDAQKLEQAKDDLKDITIASINEEKGKRILEEME